MNKIYYIVEGKTSSENSTDANINGVDYSLVKVPEGDSVPVGSKVTELTREEFLANLTSITFGGDNGKFFRDIELKFAEEIATYFATLQAGLPVATADALFTELEKASHRISRGQVTLAHYQFNLTDDLIVVPAIKALVNAKFDEHFCKIPRDLS